MRPRLRINVNLKSSLIAPCGMNCGLCLAYHRDKNRCSGCITRSYNKSNHCNSCLIRNCENLSGGKSKYCFSCKKYPCLKIKKMDKRYRTKYGMSMISNLNSIKEIGIRKFTAHEKEKWLCPKCNNVISVHRKACLICGAERII
jgi:hypothetical protein